MTICAFGRPFEVAAVQELMAHTEPDMPRANRKDHARKVLRVEMMLPYRVPKPDDGIREKAIVYRAGASAEAPEIFPKNSLTENDLPA